MIWNSVSCDVQVGKFDTLFVSESHALRVSGVSRVIGFMSLQHFAICIKLHCPQTVCQKRRVNSLAAFNCDCSSGVHTDSMFTRQTTMHLGFRVLHHAEGVPELDCMFFTVVPWTTFPQAVVSHAAVLQQSDDVCIFVSTRPTDHEPLLSVIVCPTLHKNSLQESRNVARCFVGSVCFRWCDLLGSTLTEINIALCTKFWIHSACRTVPCATG